MADMPLTLKNLSFTLLNIRGLCCDFFLCPSPSSMVSLVFLPAFPAPALESMGSALPLVTLKFKGCVDPVSAKLLHDFAGICYLRFRNIRQTPSTLPITTKLSFKKKSSCLIFDSLLTFFFPNWVLSQSLFFSIQIPFRENFIP